MQHIQTQMITNKNITKVHILPQPNLMTQINTQKTIQMVLKNPKGKNLLRKYAVEFKEGIEYAHDNNASILGISKTNIHWNTSMILKQCNNLLSTYYTYCETIPPTTNTTPTQ